jgi:RHS repeat-associated protein
MKAMNRIAFGDFNSNGSTREIGAYRYAFNGKELDKPGMGGGQSTYDYGFRIYNPAIAKFLSVDPLTRSYPMLTPYQFASNTPIMAIDLDGLEAKIAIFMNDKPKPEFEVMHEDCLNEEGFISMHAVSGQDCINQLHKFHEQNKDLKIQNLVVLSHGFALDNGAMGIPAETSNSGIYTDEAYIDRAIEAGVTNENSKPFDERTYDESSIISQGLRQLDINGAATTGEFATGLNEIGFNENPTIIFGGCNLARNEEYLVQEYLKDRDYFDNQREYHTFGNFAARMANQLGQTIIASSPMPIGTGTTEPCKSDKEGCSRTSCTGGWTEVKPNGSTKSHVNGNDLNLVTGKTK